MFIEPQVTTNGLILQQKNCKYLTLNLFYEFTLEMWSSVGRNRETNKIQISGL